jgi:hypothetical protein
MTPHNLGKIAVGVVRLSKLAGLRVFAVAIVAMSPIATLAPVGIWRSGNKRALSAGLLNWRDQCRAGGQACFAEMQSLAKDRPQQLSFRFYVLS